MLLAVVCGAFGGNMAEVSAAALGGCGEAVTLALRLTGAICLWNGVMNVAKECGLTSAVSRAFRPAMRRLFPDEPPDSPAVAAMTMNMAANLLGLGNAATPLGLAAMKELRARSPLSETATDDMVTFVVLNTASLQLIPTTVAALRLQAGSASPMEILPCVWLASACSLAAGLALARLPARRRRRK